MLRTARKGFTLIELLIVVVSIGILAAIAIPKFANTKEKAYIAAMKSDLRNLVTAESAFFADSVKYTPDVPQLHFKPSTRVSPPTIPIGPGFWAAPGPPLPGTGSFTGASPARPPIPTSSPRTWSGPIS